MRRVDHHIISRLSSYVILAGMQRIPLPGFVNEEKGLSPDQCERISGEHEVELTVGVQLDSHRFATWQRFVPIR